MIMRLLSSFIAINLLFVYSINAQISLDATSMASANGTDRLVWQHTVAGNERILLVSITVDSGEEPTQVAYNGTDLEFLNAASINQIHTSLWYLVAPPTGNSTIRVRLSNTANISAGGQSYNGVSEADPWTDSMSSSGTTSGSSIQLNSKAGDLVIDVLGGQVGSPSASSGQSEIYKSGAGLMNSSSSKSGTETTQMSWATLYADWVMVAGSLQAASVLPIELYSFDLVPRFYQVDIEWITASESNNNYFSVERSRDGVVWEVVQEMPGAGNSTDFIQYQLSDFHPYPGQSYYRIRQTDFDGQSSVSEKKVVEISRLDTPLNLFPNPVKRGEEINIVLSNQYFEETIEFALIDINGKVIQQFRQENTDFDQLKIKFHLQLVPSEGIYFIRVNGLKSKRTLQEQIMVMAND